MNFWDLNEGGTASETGTEYEVPGGGNFDPIPDDSNVLALVDEATWANAQSGEEYISLRWSVLAPEEYKNRKVFQKLWVTDLDPNAKDNDKALKKRDKARRMLAAIDANAGGGLTQNPGVPTDEQLQMALMNKPMIIKTMIWDMPDTNAGAAPGARIQGNWIAAVAPSSKGTSVAEAKQKPAKAAASSVGGALDDDLGDVPF